MARCRGRCRGAIGRRLALRSPLARGMLAEMAGSFVLVLIVDGGLAQGVVSGWTAVTPLSAALSTGMGVAFGIYTSWEVSGGHVNPSITLGLASAGKFAWAKTVPWIAAQLVGSFAGAAAVYAMYYPALEEFDGGNRTVFGPTGTGGIFATYPQPYYGIWRGAAEQIVNTGLLLHFAMSFLDERNCRVPRGTEPLVIGICVSVILLAWSHNGGASMNPARDVTGRFLCWLVGYATADVWAPYGMNWCWVATFVPLLGAMIGANFYVLCVELHHPRDQHGDYQQIGADAAPQHTDMAGNGSAGRDTSELTANACLGKGTSEEHIRLHPRHMSTTV